MLHRFARDEDGQGSSEYIITVALIAIAAIGIVSLFGFNLRAIFATSANALAGGDQMEAAAKGGGAGTANLGSFNSDNVGEVDGVPGGKGDPGAGSGTNSASAE